MISQRILERYSIGSLDFYTEMTGSEIEGEKAMYQTFLQQTDYIPNKIIEAQVLGETLNKDYTEILEARKYARQQLSEGGNDK